MGVVDTGFAQEEACFCRGGSLLIGLLLPLLWLPPPPLLPPCVHAVHRGRLEMKNFIMPPMGHSISLTRLVTDPSSRDNPDRQQGVIGDNLREVRWGQGRDLDSDTLHIIIQIS